MSTEHESARQRARHNAGQLLDELTKDLMAKNKVEDYSIAFAEVRRNPTYAKLVDVYAGTEARDGKA